jgi:hypothetical protein
MAIPPIPAEATTDPDKLDFVPHAIGKPNCDDGMHWGRPSSLYSYIMKGLTGDEEIYPEACEPWYHKNFQVDNVQLNSSMIGGGSVLVNGDVNVGGEVSSNDGGHVLSNKKNFDIPHPTKDGHRLRHVCIEGPSADVYVRGKLKDDNVIKLPEYWRGLVDPESIDVSLTPLGNFQELFVEKMEWGSQVIVKNAAGGSINCSYVVYGERIDCEKNIAEYEGKSLEDYPGDNDQYTHK